MRQYVSIRVLLLIVCACHPSIQPPKKQPASKQTPPEEFEIIYKEDFDEQQFANPPKNRLAKFANPPKNRLAKFANLFLSQKKQPGKSTNPPKKQPGKSTNPPEEFEIIFDEQQTQFANLKAQIDEQQTQFANLKAQIDANGEVHARPEIQGLLDERKKLNKEYKTLSANIHENEKALAALRKFLSKPRLIEA